MASVLSVAKRERTTLVESGGQLGGQDFVRLRMNASGRDFSRFLRKREGTTLVVPFTPLYFPGFSP